MTPFEASWTVLNVRAPASRDSCCNHCNPGLLQQLWFQSISLSDRRLFAYSGDFLFPAMQAPSRPGSRASNVSQVSNVLNASTFQPVRGNFTVNKESKDSLRQALEQWAKQRWQHRGSSPLLSWKVGLPPKQTDKIVANASSFLRLREVTPDAILKVVKLDLLSPVEVGELANVVGEWQEEATVTATPTRKKGHSVNQVDTPIMQPSFIQTVRNGPTSGSLNHGMW